MKAGIKFEVVVAPHLKDDATSGQQVMDVVFDHLGSKVHFSGPQKNFHITTNDWLAEFADQEVKFFGSGFPGNFYMLVEDKYDAQGRRPQNCLVVDVIGPELVIITMWVNAPSKAKVLNTKFFTKLVKHFDETGERVGSGEATETVETLWDKVKDDLPTEKIEDLQAQLTGEEPEPACEF